MRGSKALLMIGVTALTLPFTVGGQEFDGGIRIEPLNAPWEGQNPNPWEPMVKELRVTNETGVSWQVDGFRATWPNFTGRMGKGYQGGEILSSVINFDDGYGEDRWTILISSTRGSGWNAPMLKVMEPGNGVTLPLNIWDTPDNNWEPVQPFQYLIKTGTFGNDYGYIDHPGIRVDTLYRYLENPEYYNPDHYVPNWMGKRGGPYSGGFIDTWMTQDSLNPVPVTQLQINFLPDDVYIRMNGYDTKYRPDMMGQWTPAGKGPMYAMSLAMVQEYMNIDMQLMDAIGTHESMAALEIMEPDYNNTNPDSDYNSLGLFYANPNSPEGPTGWNATQEIGTMHYIEQSYGAYAVQSFPKFFPYNEQSDRFTKYFMTPGSNTDGREYGYCGGNNGTMANTALINSLYMWYGFNLFYNSTSFDYRTIAPLMADQEFAAKLFMASWNGGWGIGHEQLFYDFHEGDRDALINDPDVFDRVPNNGYVAKVYQALPKLVEANYRSVLNPEGPRDAEVYDDVISKEMVAEFYFGMNVDENGNPLGTSIELAQAGLLGKQGLLWHFRLSESQRQEIWNSLNTAFDLMKGRAPSTEGTDAISLRYDWITLMRVAKYYLNLDIPVPVYSEFMSWIERHSKVDRVEGVDVRDNIYPTMIIDEASVTFDSDRNFTIEVVANDNEYFDNSSRGRVIEWTLDKYWESWNMGYVIDSWNTNPDNKELSHDGRYGISVPREAYQAIFGDSPGHGWLRVSDRNRNSVVQRFDIPGIVYPRIKDAGVYDSKGDGEADSIYIKFILPDSDADDVFSVTDFINIDFTWPNSDEKHTFDNSMILDSGEDWISIKTDKLYGGAGEGSIRIEFPSIDEPTWVDEMLKVTHSSMPDRVGPAIRMSPSPEYRLPSDENGLDTFTVLFTEPISDLNESNFYLSFKSHTEDSVAIKVSSVEGPDADGRYRFLYPAGELEGFFKVKINSDSPLFDKAKERNSAITYNQWVPFVSRGNNDPIFEKAFVEDRIGFGYATHVVASFSVSQFGDNPVGKENLQKVVYRWPQAGPQYEILASNTDIREEDGIVIVEFEVDNNITPRGYGQGVIEFIFSKDDKTIPLDGSILDRVGPAVKMATLSINDRDRDYDTLYLDLTEEILKNLNKEGVYLSIGQDGEYSRFETKEQPELQDGRWKFFIEAGSINSNDSVNLVANSGIVDISDQKNPPLLTNKYQPIIIEGGRSPEIISAEIIDTSGNGLADFGKVLIKRGEADNAYGVNNLRRLLASWPDSDKLNEVGDYITLPAGSSDSYDTVKFKLRDNSGYGSGLVNLFFPDDIKLSSTLNDKVGPAVVEGEAKYTINSDGTSYLILTLSEDVKKLNADGAYFEFRNADGDTKVEKFSLVPSSDGRGLTYTFNNNPLNSYKYVRLIPGSENGEIRDLNDNPPADNNQWVEINVEDKRTSPQIVGDGEFININISPADGRGDYIKFVFTKGLSPEAFTEEHIDKFVYNLRGDNVIVNRESFKDISVRDNRVSVEIEIEPTSGYLLGDGSGEATLRFNRDGKNYDLKFSIFDKVGPSLKDTVQCFQRPGREADTLLLPLSEKLLVAESGEWLYRFEGSENGEMSSVEGHSLELVNAYSISQEVSLYLYRVVVDTGVFKRGDWVSLSSSGLTDLAVNSASSNTKRVPLDIFGGVMPSNYIASIYDVGGQDNRRDGLADSINVWMELSDDDRKLTVDSILSITYIWDGREHTITRGDDSFEERFIKLDINEFAISHKAMGGGGGSGTLRIKFKNDPLDNSARQSRDVSIEDRVAPVPLSARYIRTADNSEDTLFVRFSEDVKKDQRVVGFVVNGENSLSARYRGERDGAFIYSVESGSLKWQDSLSLDSGEGLQDLVGNSQKDRNSRRVAVDYQREVSLLEASYEDRSNPAEGYITHLMLSVDSPVDGVERDQLLPLLRESLNLDRTLSIESVHLRDRDIEIAVKESAERPNTAVSSESVSFKEPLLIDTLALSGSAQVEDRLAPVIITARIIFDRTEAPEGEDLYDTLVVRYSERVERGISQRPFEFKRADGSTYRLNILDEQRGDGDVVKYIYKYDGGISPRASDSVQLRASSGVRDNRGNEQRVRTRFVTLDVDVPPADFIFEIGNTPYDLAQDSDPEYKSWIVIRPRTRRLPDEIQAEFLLFDQVGNQVMSVGRSEFGGGRVTDGMLLHGFKPRNRSNRILGGGTYHLVANIITEDARYEYKKLFGVKAVAPGIGDEE